MHDVLRQRLMRRIESLPDEQVYQVLDFIEFLESKYAERHLQAESTGLQKFAESLEDRIRKKAMNPATLREAFQLIAAADRVLSSVSSAGRQIIDDLGTLNEIPEGERKEPSGRAGTGGAGGSVPRRTGGSGADRSAPDRRRPSSGGAGPAESDRGSGGEGESSGRP